MELSAMKKLALLVAFLGLLILATVTVQAQDSTPRPVTDDEVNAVARQLYCPVCENIPLDVCPTQACSEWRDLIRLKLSQGWNADQIKIYFAQQYGDRVLAEPPARGLNWLVYVLPPIAILAGAYILFRAFKAWQQPVTQTTTPSSPEVPDSSPEQDPYVTRLEEELKKR
jgi:cytochrome c-type biogenesis protein CcmH